MDQWLLAAVLDRGSRPRFLTTVFVLHHTVEDDCESHWVSLSLGSLGIEGTLPRQCVWTGVYQTSQIHTTLAGKPQVLAMTRPRSRESSGKGRSRTSP